MNWAFPSFKGSLHHHDENPRVGGEINTVVQCGGVTVHPGDLVVAGYNGILVPKQQEAGSIAERALAMQGREKDLNEALKSGKSLSEISGASKIIEQKIGGGQVRKSRQGVVLLLGPFPFTPGNPPV